MQPQKEMSATKVRLQRVPGINAINIEVGIPLAMADHCTAQLSLFGPGGGNACGAGQ